MAGVRLNPRDIVLAELREILDADGDDIDTGAIGGEFSALIEQRLLHLVIRSEPDFERLLQLTSPKVDDRLERLGGKGRRDADPRSLRRRDHALAVCGFFTSRPAIRSTKWTIAEWSRSPLP